MSTWLAGGRASTGATPPTRAGSGLATTALSSRPALTPRLSSDRAPMTASVATLARAAFPTAAWLPGPIAGARSSGGFSSGSRSASIPRMDRYNPVLLRVQELLRQRQVDGHDRRSTGIRRPARRGRDRSGGGAHRQGGGQPGAGGGANRE